MLLYSQNSTYFDINSVEAPPGAIIDTIRIQDSKNINFYLLEVHEINVQNIELENNFFQNTAEGTAMFYLTDSDIVTITNVTARNHCDSIFLLDSVLTQKFYNCTFTNITVYDYSMDIPLFVVFSHRGGDDADRDSTEQPATIFQDFHVDVTLKDQIFN